MAYWLVKSEPFKYSYEQLEKDKQTFWDGVRNYAARNHLKAMKKGDLVTLIGFGTFYVGKREARNGRNPRTGATIKIKAANSPKFRAGKALKDAVN